MLILFLTYPFFRQSILKPILFLLNSGFLIVFMENLIMKMVWNYSGLVQSSMVLYILCWCIWIILSTIDWLSMPLMQHWERLCECKSSELCLLYRHTLGELYDLVLTVDKYSCEEMEESRSTRKQPSCSSELNASTKKV